jgi:hypothetical protein
MQPDFWVLIPVVAILSGVVKSWLKVRAQQQVLGTSNRELEQEVDAMRQERKSLLQRLENLEAIVVSQTWEVLHDRTLPAADKAHLAANAAHREFGPAPAGPTDQQRAGQLAQRLRG